MRNISPELKAHLQEEVLTVAFIWKIVCEDEDAFFFTSHVEDIEYLGDTYVSTTGSANTTLSTDRSLAVDNMEALTRLLDSSITRDDIDAGKFDGATVDIYLVNYEDLSMGALPLARFFRVGQIETQDHHAVFEIRGIAQRLSNEIVELYGPGCTANLGDARCTKDISGPEFNISTSVTYAYDDQQTFVADLQPPSDDLDFFRYGFVTWNTGSNAGLQMEISGYDPDTMEVTLFLPMVFAIEAGDAFTATVGCDKSHATCHQRFNNVDNFRGFPSIPDGKRIELEKPGDPNRHGWGR